MKPQSPRKPSKQHMVAVSLAFKSYEEGSARDLATPRLSMKTAQNALAVFDALVRSRDDCVDAGTDSLGSKSNYEEFETAEDEEEGAEDDEDDALDLSTLLESAVPCVSSFIKPGKYVFI